MENNFDIISYVGAMPLQFGMTKDQVEKLVGAPLRMTVNRLGETNAQYESFSVRYSQTDKSLVEIGFSPSAKVTVGGTDLFETPGNFRQLLQHDSCPYEYVGFIILLDLGITLTGFHDNDSSQLAITAFTRGRWDHLKSKFTKFQMP
jgi:hypothetical protein